MKLNNHRNIYNGDSCIFFYEANMCNPYEGRFTAEVIHNYVDLLADSGIDTFLINPNTQLAWYPSKTMPYLLTNYKRGDREFFRGHAECAGLPSEDKVEAYLDHCVKFYNQYVDLTDAGVDWLEETSKACRRRGITPWISVRMNDMHGHLNIEGSFFNSELLRNKKNRLQRSTYSPYAIHPTAREGINYEIPEVRDFMFKAIREMVEDYDFEGLELDWLRQPICCEPNSTQETIDMMTNWFADIRALTEKRAKSTGKPYPFGMRVPGNLNLSKGIGIDIRALVKRGIIDFVSPSNSRQTSWEMPHDQLRKELGNQIAIYGVVEDTPNWISVYSPELDHKGYRYLPASPELMAGNAAGKLALGADGIEWYNFFTHQPKLGLDGKYDRLAEMDQLDRLRGIEKGYMFSTLRKPEYHFPYETTGQLPVILEPEWRRTLYLPMCAEPADSGLALTIQVVIRKKEATPYLAVSFNGSFPSFDSTETRELLIPNGKYTQHVEEHMAYNFQLRVEDIVEGWNEILIYNGSYGWTTEEEKLPYAVCVVSVEVKVGKISA